MKTYYKLCWKNSDTQEYMSYICASIEQTRPLMPTYHINQWTTAQIGGLAVFEDIASIKNFDDKYTTGNRSEVYLFECVGMYKIDTNVWKRSYGLLSDYHQWLKNQQQHKKIQSKNTYNNWPEGTKLFRKVKLTKLLGQMDYIYRL